MVKLFSGREEQWVSFNANGVLPGCVLLLPLLLLPCVLTLPGCTRAKAVTEAQKLRFGIC